METSTPFILSVLRAQAAGTLGDDMTRAILRETLVLLVRRKMTELATTQYDVMFFFLLGKIVNEPNPVKVMHKRCKHHDCAGFGRGIRGGRHQQDGVSAK